MYSKFIKKIHLELTSSCNARCPQCNRTFKFTPFSDPTLPINELSLDDLKCILDDERCSQVEELYINGNFGDIVMHSDPFPIIKEINRRGIKLRIHTNGSGLSTNFWSSIGSLGNMDVIFALDGLEDTHHLYRRNTRFDVIIKNARAYIDAGGYAEWQFIKFNHNIHQIEAARQLAKEYGFSAFTAIEPNIRFTSYNAISVKDKNFEHEYFLESPGVNDSNRKVGNSISNRDELLHMYDNPDKIKLSSMSKNDYKVYIDCDAKNSQTIYIGYDKRLWPCCFFGNGFDRSIRKKETNNLILLFSEAFKQDKNFNNISINSVSKILEIVDNFYIVEKEWGNSSLCDICTTYCSKKGRWTDTKETMDRSSII